MHNRLEKLKQDFACGNVSKQDFIKRSHEGFHSILHQFSSSLGNTDILKIEIMDNKVYMTNKSDGIVVEVDSCDERTAPVEAFNFGSYEPGESSVIRKLAASIDTMLDIGSNIGWYSLVVAKLNPSAKILAFEPIPQTFAKLKNNCKLNHLANIDYRNYGLSDSEGSFPFYFYPEGSGNASLKNLAQRDDVLEIECPLRTLDSHEDEILDSQTIDFVKIDVEGAELFSVRGGINLLQKHKPILLVELLRKWSAPFGYHPNEVIEMLASIGYIAYTLSNEYKLSRFTLIDSETVDTNFFFVHPHSRLFSELTFH